MLPLLYEDRKMQSCVILQSQVTGLPLPRSMSLYDFESFQGLFQKDKIHTITQTKLTYRPSSSLDILRGKRNAFVNAIKTA